MSQKENQRNHTAHFIVSKFIHSKESQEFNLSSQDKHLLREIADLIDMTYYSTNLEQTKVSVPQLITYTSMSSATIRRSTAKLLELKLLDDVVRGSGVVATYKLSDYLKTWITVSQVYIAQNHTLAHSELGPSSNFTKPSSQRATSNKASNNSSKKEQGNASGFISPLAVDNYLDKQSFQFTNQEMEESYKRDIHIQPCFDKFLLYIKNKGKEKFKRSDWESWFARETNGKNAKSATIHNLGEHFDNQIQEHEIIKKSQMPQNLRSFINTMKSGL